MRVKWWLNPESVTFNKWSLNDVQDLDPDTPVHPDYHSEFWYDENQKLVFFGHYKLEDNPSLQHSNVCCLDYSIEKKDKLVAYRYDGEQELNEKKFVWINCNEG